MYQSSLSGTLKAVVTLGVLLFIAVGSFFFTHPAFAESRETTQGGGLPTLLQGTQLVLQNVSNKLVQSEELVMTKTTAVNADIASLMALLQQLIEIYTKLLAAQGQTVPSTDTPTYGDDTPSSEEHIDVEMLDQEIVIDKVNGQLTFSFDFEITAVDSDIFIPTYAKDAFKVYPVNDKGGAVSGDFSYTIVSTADKMQNSYKIHEGDSEDVTITGVYVPPTNGEYQFVVSRLYYMTSEKGSTITEKFGEGYRTKYAEWSGSSEQDFFCKITTDKSSYKLGETMKVQWTSEGANFAAFSSDYGGKDGFAVPGDKHDANGTTYITANVVGNPYLKLKVVNSKNEVVHCTVTVEVTSSEDDESDSVTIVADFLKSKTTTRSDKTGSFIIEFAVIAEGNDITVPQLQNVEFIDKNGKVAIAGKANIASVLLSSDAKKEGSNYIVKEADEKRFTVEGTFKPKNSGFYRMRLGYFEGYPIDPVSRSIKLINNGEIAMNGFTTELLFVEGDAEISASTSPTMTLTASPTTIKKGESTKITWSSKDATYCTFFGEKTERSGSEIIAGIEVTKSYTVACYGDGGSISKSATITVEEASDNLSKVAPKMNRMSCSNPLKTGLADGALACYGVWDYGDDFGNDENMCGNDGKIGYAWSNGGTGCKVQTKACASGSAYAVQLIKLSSATSGTMKDIANRLLVTEDVLRQGMVQVWEYQCIDSAKG